MRTSRLLEKCSIFESVFIRRGGGGVENLKVYTHLMYKE